jgi:hypothetical protein
MWFCINGALYLNGNATIIVVKSLRRFRPPAWTISMLKSRSASEVVRLSDLGVVIKGEGWDYISQYYGKWMRKREFLDVMWRTLLRSYKSTKTVERMMRSLREFVDKPLSPRPRRPKRPQNVIYELSPEYPSKAVVRRAKQSIYIRYIAWIYVFSKTLHIVPYNTEHRATVVIPLNVDSIEHIGITEEGLNTLRDLLDVLDRLELKDPEVARVLKLVATLARLLS